MTEAHPAPTPRLLALDFGGTKHTAGLAAVGDLTRTGRPTLLDRRQQASPPGARGATDIALMFALGHGLLEAHGPVAAVGVSFGGPVDYPNQRVRLSHHVPGWEGLPLRQLIEEEFGAPAVIENDANCGALAEWRFGPIRPVGTTSHSLLYITVSTGIGGGWVIDGQVHHGRDSMAGEIGHTVVDPTGLICVCGRRGCVEVLAAGPAIARRAREALTARPAEGDRLRDLAGNDLERVTGALVSQAASEGDPLAQGVLLGAARDLGAGIGTAATLMNPDRVVLGGGVTHAGEAYWAEVRRAARANTLPEVELEIVPARLGEDAPLWGAMSLAEILYNAAQPHRGP